jgi:uncharacterized membrane protein YphA (DoxX/SURF4 family)
MQGVSANASKVLRWVLPGLLAFIFVYAGVLKLIGHPSMAPFFQKLGLGMWFMYFTGAAETLGGIGVLIPRFRFWAALDIAVVMVGATFTNLFVVPSTGATVLTVVLFFVCLGLAWLWRPRYSLNPID